MTVGASLFAVAHGGRVGATPPGITETVNTNACPAQAPTLLNGSFESFSDPDSNPSVATGDSSPKYGIWHGYANGPNQILFLKPGAGSGASENYVTGWKTTTNYIEIQRQVASYTSSVDMNGGAGYSGAAQSGAMTSATSTQFDLYAPQPAAGDHWAELNATAAGALYQDIEVPSSARLFWSLKHRGRRSLTDSMDVKIGLVGSLTAQTSLQKYAPTNADKFSGAPTYGSATAVSSIGGDVSSGWTRYEGTYDPDPSPSLPTRTLRFQFEASTGATIGNLLDDITFTPLYACPVQRTLAPGDTDTLDVTGPTAAGAATKVSYGLRHSLQAIGNSTGPGSPSTDYSGLFSTSGDDVVFSPTAEGTYTVDYQVTMNFAGTPYAAASRITYVVSGTPVTTTTIAGGGGDGDVPSEHPSTGGSQLLMIAIAALLIVTGFGLRRMAAPRRV